MEIKIIYLIGIALASLYKLYQKAQENKNKKQTSPTGDATPPQKPVSPPVAKSLQEVMQQTKRMQMENEAQKRRAAEAAKTARIAKPVRQDTALISELEKRGSREVELGKQTSPVMIAAEINEMDLLHADSYKHNEEETGVYEIDAKQAFIGSIIFERKY